MDLGEMINTDLGAQVPSMEFLPMVLSKNIPLYFMNVFMKYNGGGFIYAGNVSGPVYTYPLLGKDYAVAAAVTPPLLPTDVELVMHSPGNFWGPIFELIGKYIIQCKITFVNLKSGLCVPFIVGWDSATKNAAGQNKALLEQIEVMMPKAWMSFGETFNTVVHESMINDTTELWELFGDYVEMAIIATMDWTFSMTTPKTPTLLSPGMAGTFTGTMTAHFTDLP